MMITPSIGESFIKHRPYSTVDALRVYLHSWLAIFETVRLGQRRKFSESLAILSWTIFQIKLNMG